MNVKDGYLFPLVFEDSCDSKYTAYVDPNTEEFYFVSNQTGKVWRNDNKFDFEQFKIYVEDGDWVILTPQFNQTTELEEAYAKIESLESALGDAVRELISLRSGTHQINFEQFKPVQEYTLEDWELAKHLGWVFELNNGTEVFVQGIMDEFNDEVHPVELNDLIDDSHECTVTLQGCYNSRDPDHKRSIKKTNQIRRDNERHINIFQYS